MSIGQNLKSIRKKEKLTQEAFAELFGVKRSTYAAYEDGRNEPDIDFLQKVTNRFKVSLDELLKGGNKPKPGNNIDMGDRVTLIMLKEELLKLKARVLNQPLEKVLNDFEENTILRLNEIEKRGS